MQLRQKLNHIIHYCQNCISVLICFIYTGLLQMEEQAQNSEHVGFERAGGDWYYHEEQCKTP